MEMALELTPPQIAALERVREAGFMLVAFPMYAQHVGVRKENCAALLAPAGDGMKLYGDACWLVNGNLSVRVRRDGREYFVWKKQQLEATPERVQELSEFRKALEKHLT